MKKLFVVMLSAVAIMGLMVVPSFGADKLIVKDTAANNILRVEADPAMVNVTSGGASKSSLHFSLAGADSGGYVTSVAENNFFVSSGAAYDGGAWIQKSSDQNAVWAGSGGSGYSVFLKQGTAVGSPIVTTGALKFRIGYNGAITTQTSATLTAAGVWQNASSREYKENIQTLAAEKAIDALKSLEPVVYNYKVNGEKHVGFIAEDVPDLVATSDRKSLSPMDIVAVLTKVVQEQNRTIEALSAKVDKLENSSK